jgi:hypothetical protein
VIVSINQPAYLPWLGYFQRIAVSDLHIVLDHVQFEKNSFVNRNKLRTSNGSCWVTIPVKTKGKFLDLPISTLEIADDPRWASKHWSTLKSNYSKAPYFHDHAAFLEEFYRRPWTKLMDVMRELNGYLLNALGITTPLRFSSDLHAEGKKDELVLNLCRAAGASVYLSGALGRGYLREPLFAEAGIRVKYQDYKHPTYSQAYPGFEGYMGALDLLLNCGPKSLEILTSGNPGKSDLLAAENRS